MGQTGVIKRTPQSSFWLALPGPGSPPELGVRSSAHIPPAQPQAAAQGGLDSWQPADTRGPSCSPRRGSAHPGTAPQPRLWQSTAAFPKDSYFFFSSSIKGQSDSIRVERWEDGTMPARQAGRGRQRRDALEDTALSRGAGTGRLQQWGLGVLLGPPSSGNSPGLLPSTAEVQEAAGLAGNLWAACGAPARSQRLQMGSPGALRGTGRETPRDAKARGDWTAGKWGGGQSRGSAVPWEAAGTS